MTRLILFTSGEYSDYEVEGLLQIPDGLDIGALRKVFLDTYFKPMEETFLTGFDRTRALYTYHTKQVETLRSLGYDGNENRMFSQWLCKEHRCVVVLYNEINLDDLDLEIKEGFDDPSTSP